VDIDLQLLAAEKENLDLLLIEITAALIARGAINEHDVAGALLRNEHGAGMLDEIDMEGGVMGHRHGFAQLTTERWSGRFGLEPSLYALRKLEAEFRASPGKRRSPLEPESVAQASEDE